MRRWLLAAWLLSSAQAAEDLLQVGKTPAEKLEQETAQAKDKVAKALAKYELKKHTLTQAMHGFSEPGANSLPDPTQPDLEFQRSFRAMLRQGNPTAPAGSSQPLPLPQVSLAAKVKSYVKEPVAILRIGGQEFLVRQADALTWIEQGRVFSLTVQKIDEQAVTVLLSPHNLVLRLH